MLPEQAPAGRAPPSTLPRRTGGRGSPSSGRSQISETSCLTLLRFPGLYCIIFPRLRIATAQPWREGQSASLFPGEGAKKHLLFSFLLLPFFFTHVLSPSPCDRGGRLTGITRRGAPFIDAGVRQATENSDASFAYVRSRLRVCGRSSSGVALVFMHFIAGCLRPFRYRHHSYSRFFCIFLAAAF